MARLLFVEDEEEVLNSLKTFFSRSGFDVYGARSATEAEDLAKRFPMAGRGLCRGPAPLVLYPGVT